ncbi:MAG: FadR/GntR family transcriptional regulator [Nitrincola lacisaponensis]|uniref:FadR/GntR family transcriptional regulator n=1 Tax=Nitrincola lacisaponensis TaxID=267850 RepID=UPI00391CC196
MNSETPVTPRERLRQQLTQQIATGALIPGAPLPSERALAAEYSMSRASVREVVQGLVADDLIETTQGGRSRCANLLQSHLSLPVATESSLALQLEVMEARALLEGEAAYYCALRATDAQLAALDAEYQAMQQRSRGQSTLHKAKADLTFHMMIAESSHHLLVISFSQLFYARYFNAIHGALSSTLKRYGRYPDGIAQQHGRIHRAIQARNPEQARLEASEHILYTRRLLETA